MKKSIFHFLLMAIPFAFGCSQSEKKNDTTAKVDSTLSRQCFVAVNQQDTARLTLANLSSGKVKGNLIINFSEKDKNDGTLEGNFRGDTLFVDYTFKIGDKKTIYKNPLAFLKRQDSLILGVGQIETFLGKSYFVKGKPISFERGKFSFGNTVCKD